MAADCYVRDKKYKISINLRIFLLGNNKRECYN